MAQVQYNEETGMFEAVAGERNVDGVIYPSEVTEALEEATENGALENQKDIFEDMVSSPVEGEEAPADLQDDIYASDAAVALSAVPSTAAFTPTAWQANLASNRNLGEHYLMYANRVYYSGSASYWHYFLVLGSDISYDADIYTYTDCDVYSYYSYQNMVYYDRDLGSGRLNGNATLVYSDLYFDYLGVDPVNNVYPYMAFVLFLVVILLLIVGGRKHV